MTENEKLTALRLSRNSLESELLGAPPARVDALQEIFSEPGAVFVTLKNRDKSLRGCIGSLIPYRSLFEDIVENSIASAFRDPRFPPLSKFELTQVKIEISILTTPSEISYKNGAELLSKITAGVDGLIIKYGDYQATFLPSVWDEIPKKEDFVSRLCQKAGLEPDFYKSGKLEVYSYRADKFSEA